MSEEMYKKAVKFWHEMNICTDAELESALESYSILFSYHSGKIENERITYHDTREIFEHDGVTGYTGDLRTLFEIRNAKQTYQMMLDAFQERRIIDEEFIKEMQGSLTQNTYDPRRWQIGERPSEYKKHDYIVGEKEVGALAEDVHEEMAELLEDILEVPDEKAIIGAAFFHAKFENIHPFADGNGRTGRLAMNYFLILHNHPPITIYEEDRKDYYAALDMWDEYQELQPLIDFLKEQTAKTWQNQIERHEKRNHKDNDEVDFP